MNNPLTAQLMVATTDAVACVRIAGRAGVTASVDFKRVVQSLRDRGFVRFVFELSECAIMDSTFLGIMAGFSRSATRDRSAEPPSVLELWNPNPRVFDLLDNLGIVARFKIVRGPGMLAPPEAYAAVSGSKEAADRTELTRASLEAHQTLMALNPANIPKFKDVAQFLAEDLRAQEAQADDTRNA